MPENVQLYAVGAKLGSPPLNRPRGLGGVALATEGFVDLDVVDPDGPPDTRIHNGEPDDPDLLGGGTVPQEV